MNVYTYECIPRQGRETHTVVLPAAGKYADLMQKCHEESYGYVATPDDAESLTADKFRQHLSIFPEGQFMALDPRSNRVAGTTTNMRLEFDLLKHDTRSWAEITNDG